MPDLDIVTHISVEKAQPGGYHYLHESTLAWHDGALYVGWANHRLLEVNVKDELVRGRCSHDGGFTWGPAETWAEAPLGGGESFNHPVIASALGQLWGFFTRWEAKRPDTAIFTRDAASGQWHETGARIPGFIPFRPPVKLRDGNWIMSGEVFWFDGAVAISHGDDFSHWDVVTLPNPQAIKLHFAETTLLELDDRMVAICRPSRANSAPVAESRDGGRTWTPLVYSNFPLAESQPYCGTLSTGQHYLITDNLQEERALFSIAVTAPGGSQFTKVWKIRHQQYPKRRLFGGWGGDSVPGGSMVGMPTEWSYPGVEEHDGKLYISYTQGKEDCMLSIIPMSVLAV
ncbi:MAG TPA: exo-alpha-sialidase [Armatimonadota bacterium]|jgi:hypothetical protein